MFFDFLPQLLLALKSQHRVHLNNLFIDRTVLFDVLPRVSVLTPFLRGIVRMDMAQVIDRDTEKEVLT